MEAIATIGTEMDVSSHPRHTSSGPGEVVILIVGRKVGNKLIVEGEEFHGHQDHPVEPPGNGPGKDVE